MAPLKMEEQMKQKLETRTLKPSSEAWIKLEEKLESAKPRTGGKPYWWLSLAAAAVVIVFLMLNRGQNDEVPNDIVPVVEAEIDSEKEQSTNPLENSRLKQEGITSKSDSENSEVVVSQETPAKRSENEKSSKSTFKIPESDKVVANQEVNSPDEIISSPLDENIKTHETLAVVDSQKQGENSGSEELPAQNELDSEVDKLLNTAMLKVRNSDRSETMKETVKAHALLQDVEDDLDRSFRDRVFKALVSGYESVKTAVAERNN